MSESSQLNATIRANMLKIPGIFIQRIENSCGPGTPDLYLRHRGQGRSAWVENKLLKDFPKRPTTTVRIDHYTPEQRLWLLNHGSGAWLFVQVGREYFLFDHDAAQQVGTAEGQLTRDHWYGLATGWWRGRCNWVEWLRILIK